MLDKFFGGWYKTKKLEISNFVDLVFHKSTRKGGEDLGGVVRVNFVSALGITKHDSQNTKISRRRKRDEKINCFIFSRTSHFGV